MIVIAIICATSAICVIVGLLTEFFTEKSKEKTRRIQLLTNSQKEQLIKQNEELKEKIRELEKGY